MNRCPKCGGMETEVLKKSFFVWAGFIMIAVFFILSFVIPPLGIGGMILGVLFVLFAPFSNSYTHCRKCNRIFKNK